MTSRQNDTIGKIARYMLACVVAVTLVGGLGLMQAQDAIDEVHAQRHALACIEHARMCAAVESAK